MGADLYCMSLQAKIRNTCMLREVVFVLKLKYQGVSRFLIASGPQLLVQGTQCGYISRLSGQGLLAVPYIQTACCRRVALRTEHRSAINPVLEQHSVTSSNTHIAAILWIGGPHSQDREGIAFYMLSLPFFTRNQTPKSGQLQFASTAYR